MGNSQAKEGASAGKQKDQQQQEDNEQNQKQKNKIKAKGIQGTQQVDRIKLEQQQQIQLENQLLERQQQLQRQKNQIVDQNSKILDNLQHQQNISKNESGVQQKEKGSLANSQLTNFDQNILFNLPPAKNLKLSRFFQDKQNNDFVYFSYTEIDKKKIYYFDLQTSEFHRVDPTIEISQYCQIISRSYILVLSGSNKKEDPTYRKLAFYDVLEKNLMGVTDMPLAIVSQNMTFYYDQIFFFGGLFGDNLKEVSTYSFFFDLHTQKFKQIESMKQGKYNQSSYIYKDKIYLYGGKLRPKKREEFNMEIDIYEPARNSWSVYKEKISQGVVKSLSECWSESEILFWKCDNGFNDQNVRILCLEELQQQGSSVQQKERRLSLKEGEKELQQKGGEGSGGLNWSLAKMDKAKVWQTKKIENILYVFDYQQLSKWDLNKEQMVEQISIVDFKNYCSDFRLIDSIRDSTIVEKGFLGRKIDLDYFKEMPGEIVFDLAQQQIISVDFEQGVLKSEKLKKDFDILEGMAIVEVKKKAGEKIIFLGGGTYRNQNETFSTRCFIYNQKNNIFFEVAEAPHAFSFSSVYFKFPFIYVVGGKDFSMEKKVLQYNVTNNHWYQIGEMNYSRNSQAVINVLDNTIYVFGGTKNNQENKFLEKYEIGKIQNKWQVAAKKIDLDDNFQEIITTQTSEREILIVNKKNLVVKVAVFKQNLSNNQIEIQIQNLMRLSQFQAIHFLISFESQTIIFGETIKQTHTECIQHSDFQITLETQFQIILNSFKKDPLFSNLSKLRVAQK